MTVHLVLDVPERSRHRIIRWGQFVWLNALAPFPRWSLPRRCAALTRHLDEGRADVLCLHQPVTAHLLFKVPADVPTILMLEEALDQHSLAPPDRSWLHRLAAKNERSRVRRLYRRSSARAAIVVAISTGDADELSAMGVDPDRIVVVPHGIDVSYFKPDDPCTEFEFEFDVAVFGDFRFERNLGPSLAAIRWAAVHEPKLRWVFVGDIEPDDAGALRAAGGTVSGRVDDVRPYYGKTSVVLVPAVTGTGVKTTLLQAWAMSKPVVTTPESARWTRPRWREPPRGPNHP